MTTVTSVPLPAVSRVARGSDTLVGDRFSGMRGAG